MRKFTITAKSLGSFFANQAVDEDTQKGIFYLTQMHSTLIDEGKTNSDQYKQVNRKMGALKGAMLLRTFLSVIVKLTSRVSKQIQTYPIAQETFDQLITAVENLLKEMIKARESKVEVKDVAINLGGSFAKLKEDIDAINELEKAA
jgi:hypothetical protein